jgi:hypothetical protein
MDQILAQRFSFCDFSKIVGFPNPLPSRDEWESSLPNFKEKGRKYQLSICWTFMNLFINFISCMKMFRLIFSSIHYRGLLMIGVDLFPLQASTL